MTRPRETKLDQRSSSPRPPKREREAEDEQEVADHAPRQRAPDDLGQALGDGEERDDQLGRVAEAGVEEAADPGAGVMGGVLGRLADQPRQRDQGRGGEDETSVSSRSAR